MKKLFILLLTAFVLTATVQAQFTKGDRILGAGLNFQHTSTESNAGFTPYKGNANSGSLTLELGFAGRSNRMSGFFISGGYGKSETTYSLQPTSNSSSESFNTGVGVFSRRYQTLGKGFYLFAEGRAGFDVGKSKISNSNAGDRTSFGLNAGLYPGLSYRAGKRFLLDLRFADFISLNYNHMTDKGTGNIKSVQNNIGFSSSLGIGYLSNMSIGAKWILPSGKK